jgi:hypothetical protein
MPPYGATGEKPFDAGNKEKLSSGTIDKCIFDKKTAGCSQEQLFHR